MIIPWTLGHTIHRQSINAGRCINMIPALDLYGGKDKVFMLGWPGLRYWHNFGKGAEVRAVHVWNGAIYALVGNSLYRSSVSSPNTTLIDTVSSSEGDAWMNHNANGQLLLVAGGNGYIYASGVFSQPAGFPSNVAGCAFLNNYGVVSQTGKAGLNDFSSWTATDYVTAERNPDDAKGVFADHGELLLLGQETIEFFYDSGEAEATFRRRGDAFQEVGVASASSMAAADNVVFFLDNNGQARALQGYQTSIISSDPNSWQIAQLSKVSDAKGMTAKWNEKILYILTFPEAGETFVYNYSDSVKLQKHIWSKLESNMERWRGNCLAKSGQTIFVGDYENGNIYTLEETEYQDNGEPLKWVVTTQSVQDNKGNSFVFHDSLYLKGESGDYDNPQVMMRYSWDNGHNWSDELWEPFGSIGEYDHEAAWHGLGSDTERIYEFSGADAVPRTFRPPKLDATMGL